MPTGVVVVAFLIGLGFVGLGASLIATGRPRWILNRRSREVPPAVRWYGASWIATGIVGIAVIWLPLGATPASGFVVITAILAMVGCNLMAAWTTSRRANHKITVQ